MHSPRFHDCHGCLVYNLHRGAMVVTVEYRKGDTDGAPFSRP